jgi:hypothetical protein
MMCALSLLAEVAGDGSWKVLLVFTLGMAAIIAASRIRK